MSPETQEKHLRLALRQSSDIPAEIPVQATIGKCNLMQPTPPYGTNHDAIPLMNAYAQDGCPVDCGPPWSRATVELLLQRGPHRSAMIKKAVRQLRTETLEKCEQGYARVMKWKDLKANMPKNLKISPVAMIPHNSKPYRCILDLSFTFTCDGKVYPSVNDTTTPCAPPAAMTQLGQSMHRIIAHMAANYNLAVPFRFAKLDIKDGFWRVKVNDADAWHFCYVLPTLTPTDSLDDVEIVIPNSLQMGWCESPPFFCAVTETARDIITSIVKRPLPPHPFETKMLPPTSPDEPTRTLLPSEISQEICTLIEVYVDDFVGMTNSQQRAYLRQLSRAMLHGIHSLFPPPAVTGHCGADPVSEKKLEKKDGVWLFVKEILGWLVDGEKYTIQLPPDKCDSICRLIKQMLRLRTAPLHTFQQLAGRLQHACLAIPGGKCLFTPVDMAMTGDPKTIPLTQSLRNTLEDWRAMIQHLKHHPTSVLQLIPAPPAYISYTDACGLGAGGVWCSGTATLDPFLWQIEWPKDIQQALRTRENPQGRLSINVLELAGAVIAFLLLEHKLPTLQYKHLVTYCDNMSAVAWAYKMRTSKSATAGRLLRLLGMRIHAAKASSITPIHVAGVDNTMADIVSRAFKDGKFFHAATDLTTYFNSTFPLPQKKSWRACHPPPALCSSVLACLRGKQQPLASLLRPTQTGKNIGGTGLRLQPSPKPTRSSTPTKLVASKGTSWSEHMLLSCGEVLTDEGAKSRFQASLTPSPPSRRPSSWLENLAPSTAKTMPTTSPSNA